MVGRMASLLKGCNFAEVCSILGKDEALNANRYARSEAIVLSDVLKDEIDRFLTFVDERRAFSSYITLKVLVVGWVDEETLKKKNCNYRYLAGFQYTVSTSN